MAKEGITIVPTKRLIFGYGKDAKVYEKGKEVTVTAEELKGISKGDYTVPGDEKK